MKKKLYLLFFGLTLSVVLSYSQEKTNRILSLKSKLDSLSENLIPGLNQPADLSFTNISIQNFLRTIAESHSLNIQVDPALEIKISTNFSNVKIKDVLIFLCDNYNLDIRFFTNILFLSKYEVPIQIVEKITAREPIIKFNRDSGLLSLDLKTDSLSSILRLLTRLSGFNVLVSTDKLLSRLVTTFIIDAPFESALDKMALGNGLEFTKTKDGFFILSDALNNPQVLSENRNNFRKPPTDNLIIELVDGLLTVEALNIPMAEIIQMCSEKLKIQYVLTGSISGSTSLNVKNVTFDQLLGLLFRTTSYTFRNNQGIYVIGERIQEGLRKVEVVKLQYRAVDGVDKEIPTELTKGVEIKVFKDLNSFILTGSTPIIEEIKKLLLELDKPVPNILIELMVIDLKKGFTIQTGIQAFLSDSIPKTQGQVFPKVDMTLSSSSINNALSKLANNGVINLGRVTPNFYVTLKALEDNSNIDIRSTPKLSTMNGYEATLTIGRSQYYVEQTQNITGGVTPITTTSQRFNKVEANLAIIIKPVVSGNEHITLDIEAEFSDFIPATIQNAPPGNTTRKFKSKIRVQNGETLLFGGLEQESKSQSSSGVPILSKIPVLKWIFSSRTKSNQRDQLIILIKPTVVY